MMHDVVGYDALRLIVIIPASVQVPIEAREVAARDFNPDAMAVALPWMECMPYVFI